MSSAGGTFAVSVLCILLVGGTTALNLKNDLGASAVENVWTVINANGSVRAAASVPGGIYTDLQNAGILNEEFYYRFNDHEYRWVGLDDWTYSRKFTVSSEYGARGQVNLVFEGLDTVATVTLNGQQLCGCDNMFRRYIFPIKNILNVGTENTLEVKFRSAVTAAAERSDAVFVAPACVDPAFQGECHANQVRKMQASFSWDWGPAFPSVGIWKEVHLEAFDTLLIRDTVYSTTWLPGSGRYSVDVTVHAEAPDTPVSLQGQLILDLDHDLGNVVHIENINLTGVSGPQTFTISNTFMDSWAQLWWPNGMGAQPLYGSRVSYSSGDGDTSTKTDRIGYRFLKLVQAELFPGEPNKGLTFYFTVNGVPLFSKGSNWIPAHVLPELGSSSEFSENLLHASAEAGFNMLRVWGGGVYESDRFYELCDELGLLVWQDLLFACSMYPVDQPYLDTVQAEVRDTVRRLQHHPSIALWAGNNENEAALVGNWYGTVSNFSAYKDQYIKLYVDAIRPVVLAEDPSRDYVVSSPSNGLKSEQDGYISLDPYSAIYGDVHYYNYLSDAWDANIYPRTRFASEFGFQSMPSLRALNAVSAPGDLTSGINSRMLQERQHHPNGNFELQRQIEERLLPGGQYDFGSEQMLAKFIPLTQIYQAMATKTEAECHRRWRGLRDESSGEGFTMGSLYWQLNDIWQGPTWAGIEHDGTWKMLHYYAEKFYGNLLVSSYITASGQLSVHGANDLQTEVSSLVQIEVFSWGQLDNPLLRTTFIADIPAANAKELFSTDLDSYLSNAGCGNAVSHAGRSREACLLIIRLLNESGSTPIAPDNFLIPAPLGQAIGIVKPNLKAENIVTSSSPRPSRYVTAISVTVRTDAVAPFVWLDAGGIKGRFSDNGFVLVETTRTVTFYALEPTTPAKLQAALTLSSLLDHWI